MPAEGPGDGASTDPAGTLGAMEHRSPGFDLSRPGSLIAALPAVLGFVPQSSLVMVSMEDGRLGAVMRIDLPDALGGDLGPLARILAFNSPEGVVAVIVDADGARPGMSGRDHRGLGAELESVLGEYAIDVWGLYAVDRVQAGGRWHCVDGCGRSGAVDDPSTSPMAVAAVVDGRRLHASRADLERVVAAEAGAQRLVRRIGQAAQSHRAARSADPDAYTRRGFSAAIGAAGRLAGGARLSDPVLTDLAHFVAHPATRDVLHALAVGRDAGRSEALWTLLAQRLPPPSRLEALVLLAFSAYARGDGPLAGIALDEALRCDPEHRMAGMLETALQSGMRPGRIRELALSGYRVAERAGVELPPRQRYPMRAG